MNRRTLLPLVSLLVIGAIVIGAILVFRGAPTGTRKELTIIGGETRKDWEKGGFALLGGEVTSPGPTIRVKKGDQVTITFRNVHGTYARERISHNFVVVAEIKTFPRFAEPLWGAKIDPIQVGKSISVTFTPNAAGDFFYVCDVPGHPERGMYGSFIVEE